MAAVVIPEREGSAGKTLPGGGDRVEGEGKGVDTPPTTPNGHAEGVTTSLAPKEEATMGENPSEGETRPESAPSGGIDTQGVQGASPDCNHSDNPPSEDRDGCHDNTEGPEEKARLLGKPETPTPNEKDTKEGPDTSSAPGAVSPSEGSEVKAQEVESADKLPEVPNGKKVTQFALEEGKDGEKEGKDELDVYDRPWCEDMWTFWGFVILTIANLLNYIDRYTLVGKLPPWSGHTHVYTPGVHGAYTAPPPNRTQAPQGSVLIYPSVYIIPSFGGEFLQGVVRLKSSLVLNTRGG